MKHFVRVTPDGIIIEAGTVQAEALAYMPAEPGTAVHEVPEAVDPDQFYWNGGLQPLPERPNKWSVFDVSTQTWRDASDLDLPRQAAIRSINIEAGTARSAFATDIAFQGALYEEKRREAQRYLATNPAPADLNDFPFLGQEAGKTAPTAQDLASAWLSLGDLWIDKLAAIEGIRMDRIAEIDAANTSAGIEAILALALADLGAFMGGT